MNNVNFVSSVKRTAVRKARHNLEMRRARHDRPRHLQRAELKLEARMAAQEARQTRQREVAPAKVEK